MRMPTSRAGFVDASKGDDLWQRVKDAGQPFDIGPGSPNPIERIESGRWYQPVRKRCA